MQLMVLCKAPEVRVSVGWELRGGQINGRVNVCSKVRVD